MIKHIWTAVCKESRIEAETNNISLIDLYESLGFELQTQDKDVSKEGPILAPLNFEIVSLFYRPKKGTSQDFEVAANIYDPKGSLLGKFASKTGFKEDHYRIRNRIRFNNISLTVSGTYNIDVYKKEGEKTEHISSIPLDIKLKVNGQER